MKIIDNRKDYYDYLASMNGIDERIVYDRRKSEVLEDDNPESSLNVFFCMKPMQDDTLRKDAYRWEKGKRIPYKEGKKNYLIVETGATTYLFETERWLDEADNSKLGFNVTLVWKSENGKRLIEDNSPVVMCECHAYKYFGSRETKISKIMTHTITKDPIMKNTWLKTFIQPEEMYRSIYDWISRMNEPDIKDNRNDIEKLQSAGFDKKTSFRNIK